MNIEYSDPDNDYGTVTLCAACKDEALDDDDNNELCELLCNGQQLSTSDPCDECGE